MSFRSLYLQARDGLHRKFYSAQAGNLEALLRNMQERITRFDAMGAADTVEMLHDTYWRELRRYGQIGQSATNAELCEWIRSFEQKKIEAGGVWKRVQRDYGVPVYVRSEPVKKHGE